MRMNILDKYIVDFAILPVIGAVHGYITNKIAIWMLFNPKEPAKIPIVNYSIQGLLPKRKDVIAKSLSEVVEHDLLSQDDIKKYIKDNDIFIKTVPVIHQHLMDRIEMQLPKWIPSVIRKPIIEYISETIMKELFLLVENMGDYIEGLQSMLPIKELVYEKLIKLNFSELENLVRKVASKELKFIEWLGFYMGLCIGLVQGVFLILIGH